MKNLFLAAMAALLLVLAAPAPASADTGDVVSGVVGGTITQWDDKKITIRGVDDEWTLYLDPQKTMLMGHPAVDSPAMVWFTRSSDNNLWATRVYVPQTEMWPLGNVLVPDHGQVSGTVTQVNPNTIVVRSGESEWTFGMDGKSTTVGGKPAVSSMATIWYSKASNGTLYAKKIQAKK